MTTETDDNTLSLEEVDALKGATVQINHDCTDLQTGNLHMWAGLYGTLVGTTPLGGVTIAVGDREKIFDRGDFRIEAAPGAAPADAPRTAEAAHIEVRLVSEPPLMAINSPTNPRKRKGLDIDSLRALADNIASIGLAQPILVRPLPATRLEEMVDMDPRPGYEIIAGERRWRAAQMAELSAMPMLVRDLDDQAVLEIQLVENIEREDLDPMEEAEGFALLRDKLGYTVEQIAERMGKGRGPSYVRKRMKLLDLTPESREAMYDGTLQLSTGLLVARYPAEKQAEVVKFIKGQAKGGEPVPFRSLVPELYRRFNMSLSQAVFDTEDPGLVMTAGPCTTCPKRTGANQDLFGDAGLGNDSCTDHTCWADKKTAHVQRIHASAEARGMKVMDEAEAEKLLPSPYSSHVNGYTKLASLAYTEMGDDEVERHVTYADALRGLGRKAPKPMVIIHPHTCEAIEVIPNDVAEKLLPKEVQEAEAEHRAASGSGYQDTRPPEITALLRHEVRRAALLRAFDAIRTGERNAEEMRLIAYGAWEAEPELTEDYLGWNADLDGLEYDDAQKVRRDKIDAMDADQLAQAIVMASLEYEVDSNYRSRQDTTNRALAALEAIGIDVLAVRDKVDEDLARQRAAADSRADDAAAEDDDDTGDEGSEAYA